MNCHLAKIFYPVYKKAMKAKFDPTSATPYLKSMVSCLRKVVDDGYIEDFRATIGGLVSLSTRKLYNPRQVRLINFFRFEGFADKYDNAVLYVLETADGIKGTLIDTCGNDKDPLIDKFILAVQSIMRKK